MLSALLCGTARRTLPSARGSAASACRCTHGPRHLHRSRSRCSLRAGGPWRRRSRPKLRTAAAGSSIARRSQLPRRRSDRLDRLHVHSRHHRCSFLQRGVRGDIHRIVACQQQHRCGRAAPGCELVADGFGAALLPLSVQRLAAALHLLAAPPQDRRCLVLLVSLGDCAQPLRLRRPRLPLVNAGGRGRLLLRTRTFQICMGK